MANLITNLVTFLPHSNLAYFDVDLAEVTIRQFTLTLGRIEPPHLPGYGEASDGFAVVLSPETAKRVYQALLCEDNLYLLSEEEAIAWLT